MPDLLDATARQVRLDDKRAPIHRLSHARQDTDGRVYTAFCGTVLARAAGAILTTRDADCDQCKGGAW